MQRIQRSAQRLAFSCEVLRERSDRGPRQLQRPSWAASYDFAFARLLDDVFTVDLLLTFFDEAALEAGLATPS